MELKKNNYNFENKEELEGLIDSILKVYGKNVVLIDSANPKSITIFAQKKPSYYQTHKKTIKANQKKYNDKNKEKILEYHKDYYQQNKDKIINANMKNYEKNKEMAREKQRLYYQQNKDKIIKQKLDKRNQLIQLKQLSQEIPQ